MNAATDHRRNRGPASTGTRARRRDRGLQLLGAAIARASWTRGGRSHPDRAPRAGPRRSAIEVRALDFDDPVGLASRSGGDHPVQHLLGALRPRARSTTRWRWPTPGRSSTAARRPGSSASSTSPSPIRASPHPSRTSAARQRWNAPWPRSGCPIPSCARPSCSAATGCCSTTSPGCCAACRCSPSAAGATTGSEASTWTTWPGSVWPTGRRRRDEVIDAVGPDRPTFLELVTAHPLGGRQPGPDRPRPRGGGPSDGRASDRALHDVLLTRDEYGAMADGLADTDGPATGNDADRLSGSPPTATPWAPLRQRAGPTFPDRRPSRPPGSRRQAA